MLRSLKKTISSAVPASRSNFATAGFVTLTRVVSLTPAWTCKFDVTKAPRGVPASYLEGASSPQRQDQKTALGRRTSPAQQKLVIYEN